MPQIIKKKVEFLGRSTSLIDWDEFTDGRPRRLIAGKDFTGPLTSVQSSANQAAVRRGMTAKTMREGGDNLVVQFFAADADKADEATKKVAS